MKVSPKMNSFAKRMNAESRQPGLSIGRRLKSSKANVEQVSAPLSAHSTQESINTAQVLEQQSFEPSQNVRFPTPIPPSQGLKNEVHRGLIGTQNDKTTQFELRENSQVANFQGAVLPPRMMVANYAPNMMSRQIRTENQRDDERYMYTLQYPGQDTTMASQTNSSGRDMDGYTMMCNDILKAPYGSSTGYAQVGVTPMDPAMLQDRSFITPTFQPQQLASRVVESLNPVMGPNGYSFQPQYAVHNRDNQSLLSSESETALQAQYAYNAQMAEAQRQSSAYQAAVVASRFPHLSSAQNEFAPSLHENSLPITQCGEQVQCVMVDPITTSQSQIVHLNQNQHQLRELASPPGQLNEPYMTLEELEDYMAFMAMPMAPLSPRGEAVAQASAQALLSLGVEEWSQLEFPKPPQNPFDQNTMCKYVTNVDNYLVAQEAVTQEKQYMLDLPLKKQAQFMRRREFLTHARKEQEDKKKVLEAQQRNDANALPAQTVQPRFNGVFQKLFGSFGREKTGCTDLDCYKYNRK